MWRLAILVLAKNCGPIAMTPQVTTDPAAEGRDEFIARLRDFFHRSPSEERFNRLRLRWPDCWAHVDENGAVADRVHQLTIWAESPGNCGWEALRDEFDLTILNRSKAIGSKARGEDGVYLIDREPQLGMFERLVRSHFESSRTPLIVVVHGHAKGAHPKLVDRLCKRVAPRCLPVRFREPVLSIHKPLRPFEEGFSRSIIEHLRRMPQRTADANLESACAWARAIAELGVPDDQFVAIEFQLRTSEWGRTRPDHLDRLHTLLSNAAEGLGNTRLIVFACFKYEDLPRSIWSYFWNLFRGAPNDCCRNAIKDFERSKRGLVLEELPQIGKGDVVLWANDPDHGARLNINESILEKVFGSRMTLHLEDAAEQLKNIFPL